MTTRLISAFLSCWAIAMGQTRCTNCDLAAPPPLITYSRRETIPQDTLRADYEKAKKDAVELLKLAEALATGLEQQNPAVLNVATIKRLDEMEKLVKRIRGSLKRK
jgi:hypothetical protein